LLDNVVERLHDERGREIERSKQTIDDAETLRFVIERSFERPVTGEVEKLLRLLRGLAGRFTARELEALDLRRAASRGAIRRAARGYPQDDVIEIALGLLEAFPQVIRAVAVSWRGPSTPLKRAILDEERTS
jgi:hypothetical protein